MRRLRRPALLVLSLTLALAGCGSATEPTDPGSGPTSDVVDGTTGDADEADVDGAAEQGDDGSGEDGCPPEDGAAERTTTFDQAPPMCIDVDATYLATLRLDAGEIVLELDPGRAPETVNNFVFLARHRYYDGVTFHRVIPGFMAQGGDHEGSGRGGPGYRFADELPQPGEYAIGSVAMANAGPNTNGSQFFIITGPAGISLPPEYSLFGQVAEGMDVVQAIEADGSPGAGTPTTVHTINSVTISEQ